ncbi:MAG: hypothetical protein AAF458_11140 [Pseudomonadota bacterium]
MNSHLSDAHLIRFLDGRLPADEHAAIEAALATDPALADRLAALHVDTTAIGPAFETLLDNAPEVDFASMEHAADPPRESTLGRGRLSLAASLVVAAVLGALLASVWQEPRQDTPRDERWHADVVTYHKLYVPETVAPLEASVRSLNSQFERVANALSLDIPEALGRLADVEFKRAQVLGFEGTPLAHLTYQSAAGKPIALCFLKLPGAGTSVPVTSRQRGLAAVTWEQAGLGFIIVGDVDAKTLEALAKAASEAFPT